MVKVLISRGSCHFDNLFSTFLIQFFNRVFCFFNREYWGHPEFVIVVKDKGLLIAGDP